jgi:hypothetical protein
LSLLAVSKPVTRIIAVDEDSEDQKLVRQFEETKEQFEALFQSLRLRQTQNTLFPKKGSSLQAKPMTPLPKIENVQPAEAPCNNYTIRLLFYKLKKN